MRFVQRFSIKDQDSRVNKLTSWQLNLLEFLCCFSHRRGDVEIAPDGTGSFLITALLFDFHGEWSRLPPHSSFLIRNE
ncbi:conserved hypothetical protein [Mesorhizobium plurifarium]|uniref:Uncharacterized protein n=1 Tax=Mesorhizobium plurifarium TaxID=69974 RepID=A0A0K2VYX3_MESPL|nr:conserved hypothetical protein [Mesorhizobium plurifarium]